MRRTPLPPQGDRPCPQAQPHPSASSAILPGGMERGLLSKRQQEAGLSRSHPGPAHPLASAPQQGPDRSCQKLRTILAHSWKEMLLFRLDSFISWKLAFNF